MKIYLSPHVLIHCPTFQVFLSDVLEVGIKRIHQRNSMFALKRTGTSIPFARNFIVHFNIGTLMLIELVNVYILGLFLYTFWVVKTFINDFTRPPIWLVAFLLPKMFLVC